MNKWLLLTISFIISSTQAQAHESFCGYKDSFHLSDETDHGIHIIEGSSGTDVRLTKIGPRNFEINDGAKCRAGNIHVTIGYDKTNNCILGIQDGPFIPHPIVINVSCSGSVRYAKMIYDGYYTYSYTLHFDSLGYHP